MRVEWRDPREKPTPRLNATERLIPDEDPLEADSSGDEIVWAVWAAAHGTS